jgi:GNAT superfamily N-acetyltransferase
MSSEAAAQRIPWARVRRRLRKAVALVRAGEWRTVLRALRKWLYSDSYSYGLRRNLTVPVEAPEPTISVTVRPIQPSDVAAFTEVDPSRHDRESTRHRSASARLLASDIRTCYVAVTDEGIPCYMQYLIFPSENDKVERFFEGIFPRLRKDEGLLEAAFTLEEYRGLRLLPLVMNQLAEKARREGARRLLTFVSTGNVAALKGCKRVGFAPYLLVNQQFRLFRRRIVFTPLPEGTPYPFDVEGGRADERTAAGGV